MVITRVPFRMSFFGGGSDIKSFFANEGGQVISTTIDKYCYVSARDLPKFFSHSIRLAYSKIEKCNNYSQISHPLIKVILEDFNRNNIEVHHDSDLPGNSGIGSSSAFAVALTQCLLALEGRISTKNNLAKKAIYYERDVLKEMGGYQDQVAVAYGGFNHIKFTNPDNFTVTPLPFQKSKMDDFLSWLMLFYIPVERISSNVSVENSISSTGVVAQLRWIRDSVDTAIKLFENNDWHAVGMLLNECWARKRMFSGVSNQLIDRTYQAAINAGAIGGKMLGAGGGGFMLFICDPQKRVDVSSAIAPMLEVPFQFDNTGATIIHYE